MLDQRLGSAIRLVRIRRRLRQADLAALVGASAATISRMERGHLDTLSVRVLRAVGAALDIRIDVLARWRAGDLDRLLNAAHSQLHEQVAEMFRGLPARLTRPEVSFAIFGERGVIDLLAFHPGRRILLVIELKTDIADVNELIGTADRKRRLALQIARELGWTMDPGTRVAAWLIVASSRTNRRRVAAHRAMLRAAFPSDGRTVPGWLRDPVEPIRALSFWPDLHRGNVRTGPAVVRRVSSRSTSVGSSAPAPSQAPSVVDRGPTILR